MKDSYLNILMVILMSGGLIYGSIYLYNQSAVGNPLCKQMANEGYYETEWDTAGHGSCYISNVGNSWSPYKTDKTCMEEKWKTDEANLTKYGTYCVWGGYGWITLIGSISLFVMLLALWFSILFGDKKI